MVHQIAMTYLTGLVYRPDAQRQVLYFPWGGIYWEDEIPDRRQLMDLPEDGLVQILRLINIRYRLWAGKELSRDDQRFWMEAKSLVPACPIFQRLHLSPDDRLKHEVAAQTCAEFTEELLAPSDPASVAERCPGVEHITGTFYFRKRKKPSPRLTKTVPPWWRVWWRGHEEPQAKLD
jgi:hypothetical protein